MSHEEKNKVIIIAGPTASGKSALAEMLAKSIGGVIINADSMQIYKDLAIITARPEPDSLHLLYGYVDGRVRYSTGKWLQDAISAMQMVHNHGKIPIFAGGTGLYFKALLEGLAEIPEIPAEISVEAENLLELIGVENFYQRLLQMDAKAIQIHDLKNKVRLLRTYMVFKATGVSMVDWQQQPVSGVLEKYNVVKYLIEPERQWLYNNCNLRFEQMVKQGAIKEVKALLAKGYDARMPIMNAIGVKEFAALPEKDAIKASQQATRNYAKRQLTWFRHQFSADKVFNPAEISLQDMVEIILNQSDNFLSGK